MMILTMGLLNLAKMIHLTMHLIRLMKVSHLLSKKTSWFSQSQQSDLSGVNKVLE